MKSKPKKHSQIFNNITAARRAITSLIEEGWNYRLLPRTATRGPKLVWWRGSRARTQRRRGRKCPYCHSQDIELSPVAEGYMQCNRCGREWRQ